MFQRDRAETALLHLLNFHLFPISYVFVFKIVEFFPQCIWCAQTLKIDTSDIAESEKRLVRRQRLIAESASAAQVGQKQAGQCGQRGLLKDSLQARRLARLTAGQTDGRDKRAHQPSQKVHEIWSMIHKNTKLAHCWWPNSLWARQKAEMSMCSTESTKPKGLTYS